MHTPARPAGWQRAVRWVALALAVMLALVPGAGLVLCLHDAGAIHLGVGGQSGCPTGGDGSQCDDLCIDGLRHHAAAAAVLPAPGDVGCAPTACLPPPPRTVRTAAAGVLAAARDGPVPWPALRIAEMVRTVVLLI